MGNGATSTIPIGPIIEYLATTYVGDGDVTVESASISSNKHNCQDDEQISTACPPKPRRWKIASPTVITYAFTSSFGYVSQKFDVYVHADYDGCDVLGSTPFPRTV